MGRASGGSGRARVVPSAFSDSVLIFIFLPIPPPPATSCCLESLKPNTWTPWMLSTEPDWQALATPRLPLPGGLPRLAL